MSDNDYYVNSEKARGEGATLMMCPAAATGVVGETPPYFWNFFWFPSLSLAFVFALLILTISCLGSL